MNGSWFEMAIIAFIIIAIAVIVWRGGAANPEGTGSLGRKLNHVDRDVGALAKQMKEVEGRVQHIEGIAASKADIRRLEKAVTSIETKVADLSEKAASREATLDHVKQQVDRLYNFIVEKGMCK